ncbi:hypothetical protein NUU61_008207 [Penicillium alfredii]|uniref:Gfo/Idh/MocA-like oxidoreductase N-terminal domain-containing protein n=1 Tax=Penicillium alfredii TaxID=1506179 RepID=A0A9W9ES90_9EURO|nr:uncharacterized protein NUU61_008207 [Penicillium alfredii]KAJ5086900.1 hypothetical protein NUU61_008207 [Penicillium alfredii]
MSHQRGLGGGQVWGSAVSSKDAIDAVVICTPDRTHHEIVKSLAPLRLHVICEKSLATSLDDFLDIYRYLGLDRSPEVLFAVGHVMKYSLHNQLLRKLVSEDEAVGEVVGNWRNESTSGPTLLTKSCHDIDFLLWLMCEPNIPQPDQQRDTPYLPSSVSSSGSLTFFRQPRKLRVAKKATNYLSCPIEKECHFSARKIYWEQGTCQELGGWPLNVVVPDIEAYLDEGGLNGAASGLDRKLKEDYTEETPSQEVSSRQWYGRCVFESDSDVCDDQTVHITWDDDEPSGRMAKRATFHMTAFTQGVCTKQTKIFGTRGEIETNGKSRCQQR